MDVLEKQCEHATAMAKLRVLEQAASESERDNSCRHSVVSYASDSSHTSPECQLPVTATKALKVSYLHLLHLKTIYLYIFQYTRLQHLSKQQTLVCI